MIIIKIIDGAKFLVILSYKNMKSLTPLKLQKILYLAQGWSYAWDNKPLFMNSFYFYAWGYGPVNIEVYNYFKKYGRSEIPKDEALTNIADESARKTLEAVWKMYCNYDELKLVSIVCDQTPWINSFQNETIIRNEDIKEYFQSL